MNIAVWYFCFLLAYKASLALYAKRKQKYQNGNIHRKLKVPTSEREGKLSNPRARAARAPCREKIYENLRKPARGRHAHVMHWFCRGQKYSRSTKFSHRQLWTARAFSLVSRTRGQPRTSLKVCLYSHHAKPITIWTHKTRYFTNTKPTN